jgi:glycosyltransferase involved in cell wall biosynthesis
MSLMNPAERPNASWTRPVSRPKIAFFANTSWYLYNFRFRLAQQLITNGAEVVFVAPRDEYSDKLAQIGQFISLELDRKGTHLLREGGTLIRFFHRIKELRPDLILSWTPKANIYCALASRLNRVRTIPNISGFGSAFGAQTVFARFVGALYRLSLGPCPIVFFQNSRDLLDSTAAGWVSKDATRLLPGSGVDLVKFKPSPTCQSNRFRFLFAGRLLREKGLGELVEATRRLKKEGLPVELRVVGRVDKGNPSSFLENEIDALHREGIIEYVGFTNQMENLFASADCIVHPSYYREGLARTLLEGAACGRPIITTDLPGCREAVIPGESGLLCRPRDSGSLYEAMKAMMNMSRASLAAMGAAGRAYMEQHFSEEIVMLNYLAAVQELLIDRGSSAIADTGLPPPWNIPQTYPNPDSVKA